MQEYRERIAAGSTALAKVDPDFESKIRGKVEKILANPNTHVSNLHRARNEINDWCAVNATKGPFDADGNAAWDCAMAYSGMLNRVIGNHEAAGVDLGNQPGNASPKWFDAKTGEPVRAYAPSEPMAQHRGEVDGPLSSVGTALNGLLFGAKNERVRAALESGTGSAGGFSVPQYIAQQFIDNLRNATRFIEAGAMTMPIEGPTSIVRTTGDPQAGWRAENADFAEGDPTFGVINLTPKTLGVIVKVPFELLQDSVNIDQALERALVGAMAGELDRACLFGSGSGEEPLGLALRSGISTVEMGEDGGTPGDYDDLIDALFELENNNAGPPTAAIWSPRTAKTYRKLKDTTGQPLMKPEDFRELPMLTTKSVPDDQTQGSNADCSSILLGDFSQAIVAIREDLQLFTLNERFAEKGQVGFLARMRADVGFAHEESFAQIVGVRP